MSLLNTWVDSIKTKSHKNKSHVSYVDSVARHWTVPKHSQQSYIWTAPIRKWTSASTHSHITSTAHQSAYPTEKLLQAGQSEQRLGLRGALNRQEIKQTKLKRKYYTLAHCEEKKQFFVNHSEQLQNSLRLKTLPKTLLNITQTQHYG